MEFAGIWLFHAGEALLKAALNPFSCLGWLLIALLCRRRTELERKLFSVRLHTVPGEWLRDFGWGIAGALVVSLAVLAIGLELTADAVFWTWGAWLVLLLFRLRFANLLYASAIVGVLQVVVQYVRELVPEGIPAVLRPLSDSLLAIDLPSLWMLAALTLAVQAVLVRVAAGRSAMPLHVKGKRGKAIGAYGLQGFWLMPLFLAVPAGGTDLPWWQAWFVAQPDGGLAEWLPWPMLFGDGVWAGGIALLAFPAMAGFAEMTVSDLPERRIRRLAWRHLAWGMAAAGASVAALFVPALLPVSALAVLLVPEAWQLLVDRAERRTSPAFVHGRRGLLVLDVLAGSPARDMGILRGETIVKANGMPVYAPEQLHAALRSNPAFCRLEVIDRNGHNRFVHRALYSGEHHQLGLMLAPYDRVIDVVEWRPLTVWQLFRIRTLKRQWVPLEEIVLPAGLAGEGRQRPGLAGRADAPEAVDVAEAGQWPGLPELEEEGDSGVASAVSEEDRSPSGISEAAADEASGTADGCPESEETPEEADPESGMTAAEAGPEPEQTALATDTDLDKMVRDVIQHADRTEEHEGEHDEELPPEREIAASKETE